MFALPISAVPLLAAVAIPTGTPQASVSVSSSPQTSATSPRDTATFRLRARVPMTCEARMQSLPNAVAVGNTFQLGTFREYCNSPRGYALVVNYTPGTLRGTELSAGSERITLDGTGRAVLSRVDGPKIRERILSVTPSENGFDTRSFMINVVPL